MKRSATRQNQNSITRGGIAVFFSDNTNTAWTTYDQDGQLTNSDNVVNSTHGRSFDLTPFVGKTITNIEIGADQQTQAGNWAIAFNDIALLMADGTVQPFFSSQTSVSLSGWGSSNSDRYAFAQHVGGAYPYETTTYYHGDHLGSSRLITDGLGHPIWQATYLPYGEEYDKQITTNHYEFTGKERDTETGLDYFGARYYGWNIGRWLSPDWSSDPDPIPYADYNNPQTLNLYQYVQNTPLNATDPEGHKLNCHTNISTPDADGNISVHLNCHEEPDPTLLQRYEQWKMGFVDSWHQRIEAHRPPPQKQGNYQVLQDINNLMMGMVPVVSPRFGFRNGLKWRQALKELRTSGTKESIAGEVPTRAEATEMIEQSGGTVDRGGYGEPMDHGEEVGHPEGGVSDHTYPHINYRTPSGAKATVKVVNE